MSLEKILYDIGPIMDPWAETLYNYILPVVHMVTYFNPLFTITVVTEQKFTC